MYIYVNVTFPASLSVALHRKCQVADDDSTPGSAQLDCSRLTRGCNTRDICAANWNANLKDGVYGWVGHPYSFSCRTKKFGLYFCKYPFTRAKEWEREREGGGGENEREKEDSLDRLPLWRLLILEKLRGFASVTGSLENLYTYETNPLVVLFPLQCLRNVTFAHRWYFLFSF